MASQVAIKLPLPPTHVSWVGCVQTALASLGVQCDTADVAGFSGYAFILNIHPELCPSGPTAFDWSVLVEGTQSLGIEVELVSVRYEGTMPEELSQSLFERVSSEISAGRPCVIWGAKAVPEFAVVCGISAKSYVVQSYQSAKEPADPLGHVDEQEILIPYDSPQASGLVAGFFFGERVQVDLGKAARTAVVRALKLLKGSHPCFYPAYYHGTDAFSVWARVIEQGSVDPLANAYNLACYAELHAFGADFLRKLSRSTPSASDELAKAASELAASAANLKELGELLVSPEEKQQHGRQPEQKASRLLRDCSHRVTNAQCLLGRALIQL